MKPFNKILIANRGEIAVRIIKTARSEGIETVSIYADDDKNSLHVQLASQSIKLAGKTLQETYLNQDKIIEIALECGVDAIHPGYGFLSENSTFSKKVAGAGLIFIGPSPQNISLMGEKNQALAYVDKLGIPILKSYRGNIDQIFDLRYQMDFPVIVKASGGGGGKGMSVSENIEDLMPAMQKAQRQALTYFGNDDIFVEKYITKARHIEVQIVADNYGNIIHLFERECTIQRRFQKVIEEAPSPTLDDFAREKICSAAVNIAREMNYKNAGTIEFLVDVNNNFYFLEMNTRIQVEHPVTETITNTDIVSLQLKVASGQRLELKQDEIKIDGHSIELRICAEDATNNFKPAAGELLICEWPNKFARVETFIDRPYSISANYDSLIAKIIAKGENRQDAIKNLKTAILETRLAGIPTNINTLKTIVDSNNFAENKLHTVYIDENIDNIKTQLKKIRSEINKHYIIVAYIAFKLFNKKELGNNVWNQIGYWRISKQIKITVENHEFNVLIESQKKFIIDDKKYNLNTILTIDNSLESEINNELKHFDFAETNTETLVLHEGHTFLLSGNLFLKKIQASKKIIDRTHVFQNLICADLFGKVLNLKVAVGEIVRKGDILITIESMKTEIHIVCPNDAVVSKIHVTEREPVIEHQLLAELKEIN